MIYYNYEKLCDLLTELSILIEAKVSLFDADFQPTRVCGNTDNLFCAKIKSSIKKEGCAKSDLDALNRCSYEPTIHYHCHFGFIEIMVKEMLDDIPLYLCIGPFRDPSTKKRDIERIKDFTQLINGNYKELLDIYLNTPIFTEEKYQSICTLGKVIFEHAKETKIIAIKEDLFESEIGPFLKANLDKNYSVNDLCNMFAIPQKKFHAVIRKSTGLSPKQYITKLKIDKAFNEIILTNKDLQVIASEVGMEDYNYFIKIFKSLRGHTPKYFRKESENNNE